MTILSATMTVHDPLTHTTTEGVPVPPEIVQQDLPRLTEIHQKAMNGPSLWCYFGGTIDLENRSYQVAP